MNETQVIILIIGVPFAIGLITGGLWGHNKGFNQGVRWGKRRMRHLDQYAERPQEWYSE